MASPVSWGLDPPRQCGLLLEKFGFGLTFSQQWSSVQVTREPG